MRSRFTRIDGIAAAQRDRTQAGASAMPDEVDIWQAASLFVGVYGVRALHVAATRLAEIDDDGDHERQVWSRIMLRIGELLCDAPPKEKN